MASNYPAALDALATSRADSTATPTNHAQDHNNLADAINKIEAELGVIPAAMLWEHNSHVRLSRVAQTVAGSSSAVLLASSMPVEATTGITTLVLTAARIDFSLCWLRAGAHLTSFRVNVTGAGSATPVNGTTNYFRGGVATYNGSVMTVVNVTTDITGTTGMKSATSLDYTVPTTGLYYIFLGANFSVTQPTVSGTSFDDSILNMGFTSSYPRHASIASGAAAPSVGSTYAVTTTQTNVPWYGATGTM